MDVNDVMKFRPETPIVGDQSCSSQRSHSSLMDNPTGSMSVRLKQRIDMNRNNADNYGGDHVKKLLAFDPSNVDEMEVDDIENELLEKEEEMERLEEIERKRRKLIEKQNQINKLLDDDEQQQVSNGELTEHGARRLLSLVKNRTDKNECERMKYAEEPKKFMKSEIELHEAIQQLNQFSMIPKKLELFDEMKEETKIILNLIQHPNIDISIALLQVLIELTSEIDLNEKIEEYEETDNYLEEIRHQNDFMKKFALILIDQFDFLQLLFQSILSLQRSMSQIELDDSSILIFILNLLENFSDLLYSEESDDTNHILLRQLKNKPNCTSNLIQWILHLIRHRIKTTNDKSVELKSYAIELLADFSRGRECIMKFIGESHGIDTILRQLNIYKRSNPQTSTEYEMMENMFGVLSQILIVESNKEIFLKDEGVQLMILIWEGVHLAYSGSCRVLDYLFDGPSTNGVIPQLIVQFISSGGLRSLFPIFMERLYHSKKMNVIYRIDDERKKVEQHCINILVSLFRHTEAKTDYRSRILGKFLEHSCERIQRIFELFEKYLSKKHFDYFIQTKIAVLIIHLWPAFTEKIDHLVKLKRVDVIQIYQLAKEDTVDESCLEHRHEMKKLLKKFKLHHNIKTST
ncbi:hypothetical protein SNEBB_002071 [Seison nebaliae]|nr:hypothetical protein SNEBB_002071 [Seison nebaliae]